MVFDGNRALREKHGATGHRVYHGVDDPTGVMVVTTFASAEGAAAFATDPVLKEAIERAGRHVSTIDGQLLGGRRHDVLTKVRPVFMELGSVN